MGQLEIPVRDIRRMGKISKEYALQHSRSGELHLVLEWESAELPEEEEEEVDEAADAEAPAEAELEDNQDDFGGFEMKHQMNASGAGAVQESKPAAESTEAEVVTASAPSATALPSAAAAPMAKPAVPAGVQRGAGSMLAGLLLVTVRSGE